MAAPASKTIGDLSGKWVMNKTLSSNPEPALALQGIGWVARKAVGLATLTLHVKQFVAPPSPPSDPSGPACTHIEIEQTGTAGLKAVTERRCLDYTFREHKDYLFGHVQGRSKFLSAEEVEDAFLKSGWLEGEEEKKGPGGESHLISYVESLDSGWTATQIWGFKVVGGERRYVRNVLVVKGEERVELQLVYDFIGEQ